MKPEIDQILSLSAGQLMGTLAPLLPSGYAQGSASLLGFMMLLSAQEYDRAAEIRVAENDAMRALFGAAASMITDAELREALAQAAELREGSLRISVLNEINATLRRLLIRLQASVEKQGPRDLERRIWLVLKDSAERRLLRLA